MTTLNRGYETAEPSTVQPGIAEFWTSTSTATLEETAEFAGDTGLTLAGYETFEHGWGSADPQVLLNSMGVTAVEALPIETFELGWATDEGFMFLTALESASFDSSTESFENFEDLWGGPLDADFTLSPSEVASALFFNLKSSENFEDQWGDVAYTLPGPAVETAVFSAGGLSISFWVITLYESFELRARQRVNVNVSANKLEAAVAPLALAAGDAFTVVAESGDLPDPLTANTTYLALVVAANATTLQATASGPAIDLTTTGSGANYLVSDPGRFWLDELV